MFEQSGASTIAPPKGPIGSAPEQVPLLCMLCFTLALLPMRIHSKHALSVAWLQGALDPGDMPKPKTGQV